MAYVVKNEGSWVLFTKSNYLLNRALLNRGLGVLGYKIMWCNKNSPYHFITKHSSENLDMWSK